MESKILQFLVNLLKWNRPKLHNSLKQSSKKNKEKKKQLKLDPQNSTWPDSIFLLERYKSNKKEIRFYEKSPIRLVGTTDGAAAAL